MKNIIVNLGGGTALRGKEASVRYSLPSETLFKERGSEVRLIGGDLYE